MLVVWLAGTAAVLLASLLLSLARRSMFYWKSRGVPHHKPLPLLGNYLPVLTLRKAPSDMYNQLYQDFPDEPMVGLYEFTNPVLVVRSPDLIEQVLVRDFNSYPDHGSFIFEPASLMHEGIFMLYGNRWRAIRNKLLQTFSTGRMRSMFPGMVSCCEELLARDPQQLDRTSISNFAVDCFLRTLFDCKLQPEKEAELWQNVKTMFDAPVSRYLPQQFLIYYPRLANLLGMKFIPGSLDSYFRSLLSSILETRARLGGQKKDYTDVLLRLRDSRLMSVFDKQNREIQEKFEVTDNLVISQGFMFFFAGMDTTSLVMLYTALELAANPPVQQRAREEVRQMVAKHGGLTYDAVRQMKYIDQCIQEALRLHPSLVILMRVVDRPTSLGGVLLEPGTRLIVPIAALHLDAKYFQDPLRYDPDRFAEPAAWTKFTHLPFSDGPRVCAGKKFSMVEITTLIAHLLLKYNLTVGPETKIPVEYHPRTVFLAPKSPVVVRLTKLQE